MRSLVLLRQPMQHSWAEAHVLVVDPGGTLGAQLEQMHTGLRVTSCSGFVAARQALLRDEPAVLVTDLRLGAYNGLHLAYLAVTAGKGTRPIVLAGPMDSPLAGEAQRIGAFVEWRHRAPFAIPGYLSSSLPERDRRGIDGYDRRRDFRGGRRAADVVAAFNVPFGAHGAGRYDDAQQSSVE